MKTKTSPQRAIVLCALVNAAFAAGSCAAADPSVKIEKFDVPTSAADVYSIAAGDSGDMWFVETTGDKIGKISATGAITEFPIPTSSGLSDPIAISKGADSRMWFTTLDATIGAITSNGAIQNLGLGSFSVVSYVAPITSGSDKRLYFVDANGNIGALTTDGKASHYVIPTPKAGVSAIASGADGNIWFTEFASNKIARMTVSGSFTEFPLPVAQSQPSAITAGPDGNIWFIENRCPACEVDTTASIEVIGRITPSGTITEFNVPSTQGKARYDTRGGIVAGPDGALWFTEPVENRIGRMSTSGVISEFDLPAPYGAFPVSIALSTDGHLWVASTGSNQDHLYKITTDSEFGITSATTGSWYDPNQSGQGFSLEVLPGNVLLAYWYTFTPGGEATWITASGNFTGNSATLDGYQIVGSGAKFPPYFDAKNVHAQLWGTLTFTFSDCTDGKVDWTTALPGYGAGTMNLKRLTQPQDTSCH